MIAIIALMLVIASIATVAALAAHPFLRTLSIVIDNWADEVQGAGGQLR